MWLRLFAGRKIAYTKCTELTAMMTRALASNIVNRLDHLIKEEK
ncbi:hypothetical protein HMPREF0541_02549 [Lacticaseibacillus rhamnosus ATCC 21052]|nr:hypothetical protein HMPREF0541_02549 [Lacticaseibacillus rhamnosus ATCC 21052]